MAANSNSYPHWVAYQYGHDDDYNTLPSGMTSQVSRASFSSDVGSSFQPLATYDGDVAYFPGSLPEYEATLTQGRGARGMVMSGSPPCDQSADSCSQTVNYFAPDEENDRIYSDYETHNVK
jgi:hypothetical protein